MLASSYPTLEVFKSNLYLVLLLFWIILVFHIMFDVFRSHDLSGPAKALWIVVMLVLPLLGCLIYVLVRGGSMHEREIKVAQMNQKTIEDYIRQVANTKE
jgi:hypothetical protein